MRPLRIAAALVLAVLGVLGLAAGSGAQGGGTVNSIEFSGTVDPATERWIDKALGEAADEGAELVVIRLDTPGGLDSSMREIIKDIIAAPMPVVVYVSPDGARAASAGLFITQAADVAAMAPQTNIGSASPVSVGGGDIDDVLGRKIENDAAAYVRALAEVHGRNPDLAEEMVRDATNVSASVALDRGLIDFVAGSEQELLAELDGFRVKGPKAGALETAGLQISERGMPLQYELLQIIVNPSIAYILLLIGILGIGFEVFNPGGLIPGAFGGISFLLGLYGTAQLPFTAVGIILLVLGVALVIAEAHLPTGGVLGVAGVAGIALSGLLLFDTDSEALEVSPPVVIVIGLAIGGLIAVAVSKAVAAGNEPVRTGWEELIGDEGVVRVALDPAGQVFIEGALWRAEALGGSPIRVGDRVRVESIDGLTLGVRPVEEADTGAAGEGDG